MPVSVSVPVPRLVTEPTPSMTPAYAESSERSKTSDPLLVRLVASVPPVVPVPICRVPPDSRAMVPDRPRASVPPTIATPLPEIESRPVPPKPA